MCLRAYYSRRDHRLVEGDGYIPRLAAKCCSVCFMSCALCLPLFMLVMGLASEYWKFDEIHRSDFTVHGYNSAGTKSDLTVSLIVLDIDSGDGTIVKLNPWAPMNQTTTVFPIGDAKIYNGYYKGRVRDQAYLVVLTPIPGISNNLVGVYISTALLSLAIVCALISGLESHCLGRLATHQSNQTPAPSVPLPPTE
jgi:hypothetical protein